MEKEYAMAQPEKAAEYPVKKEASRTQSCRMASENEVSEEYKVSRTQSCGMASENEVSEEYKVSRTQRCGMASENEVSGEYKVSTTQSCVMASESEVSEEYKVLRTQSCGMAPASEGSQTGITSQMSSITLFSRADIVRATNGLRKSSGMWLWRYGRYYKGYVDDNTEVYIKMLDPKLPMEESDFIQELNVLEELRHPNLAELVGACIDPPAVLYKFPDENLELCLETRPRLLTWQIRTGIIYQVCSALIFLYSNKRHPGHLTPANILLDGNFNCTVSIPEGTATSNPNPKGRFTEYIETGNRKLGDGVYSLGIVVLRLLTGLSAATIEGQSHGARISEWLTNNVDHTAGNWPPELVEELAYFGPKCCYSSKSSLLSVKEIVKELGNFLAVIDNFKNRETILCSDYKDSKSIMIEETCGTTWEEEEELHILSRTSRVKVFTYPDIKRATNGFSESSRIGQGGYGTVYKGYLDNTEVAIKMLNTGGDQGPKEFIRELAVLGQIRHPNLVRLIGACFTDHSLVYEFLPNGSLEDCLEKSPRLLTWQMRTRVVYEICSALIFLHSNEPGPIVHGDLKPANILLDANFNSKLTDFGLCRFLSKGTDTDAFHHTHDIKGTEWYMDPDFYGEGKLSPRCDVYSFGVTILRILTGESPAGIVRRVRKANEGKSLLKMVDSKAGLWPDLVAEYLARIGLKCCDPEGRSSALMMEIFAGLENILAKIGSTGNTTI